MSGALSILCKSVNLGKIGLENGSFLVKIEFWAVVYRYYKVSICIFFMVV